MHSEKNTKLKENFEYIIEEAFNKPAEIQEVELAHELRDFGVTANELVLSGQRAISRFKPVHNLLDFVQTVQRNLHYELGIRSGVFKEIRVKGKEEPYPGPLRIFWERVGIPEERIGGSIAYCDENGIIEKIVLEIEGRKKGLAPDYLQYLIGLTDYLKGDFPMIDVSVKILPIALLFGEEIEIPRGVAVACPKARRDMMEAVKPILKVERGFVEEIGGIDVKKAEDIGRKIRNLLEICLGNDSDFEKYRKDYADKSFEFLDTLSIKIDNGYPIFPVKWTEIRSLLNRLRYTSDIAIGKDLMKETAALMRRYSPEFPR